MKLSKRFFNKTSFELKQVEVTNVTAHLPKKVGNHTCVKMAILILVFINHKLKYFLFNL